VKDSKEILILGAGEEQVPAIHEALLLGLDPIVFDGNENSPGFSLVSKFATLDIKNPQEILRELNKRSFSPIGIFSHAVEIPEVVSEIASILGLRSIPLDVAQRCTIKNERIEFLSKNNIPTASFEFVKSVAELEQATRRIGFPFVIKPVHSAGARGVKKINSLTEALVAYSEIVSEGFGEDVLLEEFLSGPQISTESIVANGKIVTYAFADRNYSRDQEFYPYFVEDGVNFPSNLPNKIQKRVLEIVEATIRALGITSGAAKGDIILKNGKPVIIEMACRTSGGWFSAGSISFATGINPLKFLIQQAVGIAPDFSLLEPKMNNGACQRYVIPAQSGRVISVSGAEEAAESPGVVFSNLRLPSEGDYIKKSRNHSERFGSIIVIGNDREDAITKCEKAISLVKIQVEG
jgi:biotin carboxylase